MPRLADLLDGVARFIRRYVVISEHEVAAVALWIAHAHAIEAADVTPYLAITSPEKRAGKTKLLEVIELLVPHPLRTANISTAALFRSIVDSEHGRATLLFDEAERTLGVDGHEDLIALFNAGYRRGAFVVRCEGEGKKIRVARYDAFGAKAIAAIRRLPDTIADRAIPIQMQRRARHEPLERFRQRDVEVEAAPLRLALADYFTPEVIERLRSARPEIPDALDDRAADGWEPLCAIADLVVGAWPTRARAAAVALHTGRSRDDDGLGVQLLGDLYGLFTERGTEKLSTPAILEALAEDDGLPWGDLRGRRLTGPGMARLLRPFGIVPAHWREGTMTVRGYERVAFAEAWAHWLSKTDFESAQSAQSNTNADFVRFAQSAQAPLVPSAKNDETPRQKRVVPIVPTATPSRGEDGRDYFPGDDGRRSAFVSMGALLGWPGVDKDGIQIPAGRTGWLDFARRSDDETIVRALEVIQ